MARFFERRGWRCISIADGAAAEGVLFSLDGECAFDVVLCDLRLPYKSGLDLYQRASTERPDVASRFVLVSGDADGVQVACPILWKPFPLCDVAVVADAILSRNLAAA